jgi:hypothetical protein
MSQFVKLRLTVVAAPNTSLICHDHDEIACPIGGGDQLENTLDELELLGPMDVPVINIDHPIPIQKQSRPVH